MNNRSGGHWASDYLLLAKGLPRSVVVCIITKHRAVAQVVCVGTSTPHSVLEALDWAVLSPGQGGGGGGGGTVRQLQLCLMMVGRAVGKVIEGLQSLQQGSSPGLSTKLWARAASPSSAGRVGNNPHA